jgi:hypothetical protein
MRFLSHLGMSACALAFLLAMGTVERVACGLQPAGAICSYVLPEWFEFGLWAAVVLGFALSARRYWLDFYRGEYYLDLEDPHWRDRQGR